MCKEGKLRRPTGGLIGMPVGFADV